MVHIAGTIEFHISDKENSVACIVMLSMGHIGSDIDVDIGLKKGYNHQKIRELFKKHPIWNTTHLIPIFNEEEGLGAIEFAFENIDYTPKALLTIAQEVQSKIIPIFQELEPLTRMENCPTCGHSSDAK